MKMHIYLNLQFIDLILSCPYNFGTRENLAQLISKHAIIILSRHPMPKPYNFVTAYGRKKRNFKNTFNVSMDFSFAV
jgi:hypothetical protein